MKPLTQATAVFSRIAALAAILVSGFGQTVHIHQECGQHGCASHCQVSGSATDSPGHADTHHCCSHGHAAAPQDSEVPANSHVPQPGHDDSHCAVCSVLAQAPQAPDIAGLPDVVETVGIVREARRVVVVSRVAFVVQTRGPPACAADPAA
ncbi:MAG: hypothetical protein R3C19_08300 [Planctomycetaceae bacterium]